MFKIEENTIHITRGDKGTIELTIEDYTFKVGDKIELRIYKKKGLNELPLKEKEVIVEEETPSINIELTPEDTKIGDIANKATEYWYEIELNDEQTVVGFDEEGAKILMLYPEGADTDDTV